MLELKTTTFKLLDRVAHSENYFHKLTPTCMPVLVQVPVERVLYEYST